MSAVKTSAQACVFICATVRDFNFMYCNETSISQKVGGILCRPICVEHLLKKNKSNNTVQFHDKITDVSSQSLSQAVTRLQ